MPRGYRVHDYPRRAPAAGLTPHGAPGFSTAPCLLASGSIPSHPTRPKCRVRRGRGFLCIEAPRRQTFNLEATAVKRKRILPSSLLEPRLKGTPEPRGCVRRKLENEVDFLALVNRFTYVLRTAGMYYSFQLQVNIIRAGCLSFSAPPLHHPGGVLRRESLQRGEAVKVMRRVAAPRHALPSDLRCSHPDSLRVTVLGHHLRLPVAAPRRLRDASPPRVVRGEVSKQWS